MYVSSKLATRRVLAVTLAITLWGFGVHGSQARAAQKSCSEQGTQTFCPVDSHAQHEAEEAREHALAKEQKEAEHTQHEAEEAQERATDKRAKANATAGAMRKASEPVAEEQPKSETEIIRAKPAPEPELVVEPKPAVLVLEGQPAPAQLPKTASSMPLIGLIGLVSLTGYLARFFLADNRGKRCQG